MELEPIITPRMVNNIVLLEIHIRSSLDFAIERQVRSIKCLVCRKYRASTIWCINPLSRVQLNAR